MKNQNVHITGCSQSAAELITLLILIGSSLTRLAIAASPFAPIVGTWNAHMSTGQDRVYRIEEDGTVTFKDPGEFKKGTLSAVNGEFVADFGDRLTLFYRVGDDLKIEAFNPKSRFTKREPNATGTGRRDQAASTPAVIDVARQDTSLRVAGSRRGQFVKNTGVSFDVCGSWAAMHKLVNGEADVAIIDIEWSDYSRIIRETTTDQAKLRVTEQDFTGLKGQPLGEVALFFAHNLKTPLAPTFSPADVITLLKQKNWKEIGGPNAPVVFAEWPDVATDSYKGRLNTERYTPLWLFLNKREIRSFSSMYHMRDGATFDGKEVALLVDRTDAEKLGPGWTVSKQPMISQPIFAVFRNTDAVRVEPVIKNVLNAGAARGDLAIVQTNKVVSTSPFGGQAQPTPAADTQKANGRTLTLAAGWDTPLKGGTATIEDLAKLFGELAKANTDLAAKDIKLYEEITYLMPIRTAFDELKLRVRLPSKVLIACPGLPRDSFFYYAFDGLFDGSYNRLYLVVDRADQVVSVQLVNETPKAQKVTIYNDRDRGWHTYNFVNTRTKAMNTLRIDHRVALRVNDSFEDPPFTAAFAPKISAKNEKWTVARVDTQLLQADPRYPDRNYDLTVKEQVRWYVPRPIVELILTCVQKGGK